MVASLLSSIVLHSNVRHHYPAPRYAISTSPQLKLNVTRAGSRFGELPLDLRHFGYGFGTSARQVKGKSESLLSGGCRLVCGCHLKEGNEPDWPVLKRWEVPWEWPTVSLTMLACGLSFILTGVLETAIAPILNLQITDLTLDDKAGILFVDQLYELTFSVTWFSLEFHSVASKETNILANDLQNSCSFVSCSIVTGVVLGVIFGISNRFKPLPDDIFRYKLNDPFSLKDGWLLWAVIGLVGAIVAIALLGAVISFFSGESPQRETDALVRLLPLIGSSTVSTAFLVGITGVLAPILEETIFRGFLMVSLTKWFPTPVSVLLTAAVFAIAHLTPGEFPQLFVLGAVLGFSYAHTRNLVTPITIHAFWNSGVILLLTFFQLQGYDIKELLRGP